MAGQLWATSTQGGQVKSYAHVKQGCMLETPKAFYTTWVTEKRM